MPVTETDGKLTEAQRADHYDDGPDDTCPNCGGEGVIYACFEEYACIDPESGCDLCERRCDWCRPPRTALSKSA